MDGGSMQGVAGDADVLHQPFLARSDRRLERTAWAGGGFPLAVLNHRVQLDQVEVVSAQALQRTLEESRSPLFIPVPSLPLRKGAPRPEEYVARLIRRAVGYQIRIRR